MSVVSRSGFAGFISAAAAFFAAGGAAGAAVPKVHHVSLHITQNDPGIMNMLLSNFVNLTDAYTAAGETSLVEVVAYGPGLHIFRADTSPVKERLTALKLKYPSVIFSACNNTKMGMEKAEGHPIEIVPEARIVPAGIVRLNDLQEQGYTYVKP